jgi:hypothetical protein
MEAMEQVFLTEETTITSSEIRVFSARLRDAV